ncbi:hypothetical protein [Haloarcula nitratireducens]|uniref:Uncharacterized protein n=1 Tax=Haloarcula nitratireducens TaxID=2487749 RepID=A0AAW4PHZ2_9EURY|nr:hypothetical protein [Halomicroarcula nitratireducens]MBX0297571.1 hypothetical protein [Halomicroarcula nitratireducens]
MGAQVVAGVEQGSVGAIFEEATAGALVLEQGVEGLVAAVGDRVTVAPVEVVLGWEVVEVVAKGGDGLAEIALDTRAVVGRHSGPPRIAE